MRPTSRRSSRHRPSCRRRRRTRSRHHHHHHRRRRLLAATAEEEEEEEDLAEGRRDDREDDDEDDTDADADRLHGARARARGRVRFATAVPVGLRRARLLAVVARAARRAAHELVEDCVRALVDRVEVLTLLEQRVDDVAIDVARLEIGERAADALARLDARLLLLRRDDEQDAVVALLRADAPRVERRVGDVCDVLALERGREEDDHREAGLLARAGRASGRCASTCSCVRSPAESMTWPFRGGGLNALRRDDPEQRGQRDDEGDGARDPGSAGKTWVARGEVIGGTNVMPRIDRASLVSKLCRIAPQGGRFALRRSDRRRACGGARDARASGSESCARQRPLLREEPACT